MSATTCRTSLQKVFIRSCLKISGLSSLALYIPFLFPNLVLGHMKYSRLLNKVILGAVPVPECM